MDACTLTYTVNTVAIALAKCLDEDELELLAAVLTQLGDTLATIAVQQGLCRNESQNIDNRVGGVIQ